ncbi:arginine deiminase family protein [Novosphingobium sp.]|uniref:dimethylarginine dimethylaminohydrolase family protein n=1 Tax=Novosphingobium sp. TaxID=1874826 RepID=UPI00286BCB60|nr:arginine deiminase family protein [Novosphingobium sp.]
MVRTPGPSAVKGLRAGRGPDPDFAGLLSEHAGYVAALEAAGIAVTVLDPLATFPDALFVEDPALVFREGMAVLLNPGVPSRAGEVAELAPALAEHFEQIETLAEGHADGGDVLVMPGRAFIGLSARTDRAGAKELARILELFGLATTIVTPPPGVLHLKTACSLIDAETVLATGAIARSGLFADYCVIEVPADEEGGANVLRLADRVLMGSGYPRIADLIAGHGAEPVPLETGAIAMIDAGLTCMSLRW